MRVLSFLMLLLSCFFQAAPFGQAWAEPAGLETLANPVSKTFLIKAGQGCGWDYPCPPDPSFGRPLYLRQGQVTIRNNYGPINVYPDDARPAPWEGAAPGDCGDGENPDGCGALPEDEECGAFCWLRRFREGYCGHGCRAYREQARIEAEERAREEEGECARELQDRGFCYSRPLYPAYSYKDQRPSLYRRAKRWIGRPFGRDSKVAPPRADFRPRERFEGPRYPANCGGGAC